MNVTATATTGESYLSVFPAGGTPPRVSNLNWTAANVTIPNLVTVKIGTGGKVTLYNNAGSTHVIADLAGYYVPGNDKFISVDVLGHASDTATFSTGFGANAGLGFADGVSNTASFHFVLPPDYTPGGAIVGKFTWHTSATSCAVNWRANWVSVSRSGQTHNQSGSASNGMSEPGVAPAGSTSNLVQTTTFTLSSPLAAVTLQPGDSYTIGLYRFGGNVADTCAATAKIDSMVIVYE